MVSHVSEALGRLDAAATFVEGVPSDGGARAMDLIAGVFRGKDVRVHSFEGTEALSELFHYEVTFTSPLEQDGPDADLLVGSAEAVHLELEHSVVGQSAILVLRGGEDGATRVIQGIASHLERLGPAGVSGGRAQHGYRLGIAPRMSIACLRTNTRIFQSTTVKAIVDEVLGSHGVVTRWPEGAAVAGREFAVQYQETDYAFVCRLLAEIGYFFFFESSPLALAGDPTPETVVICGRADSYLPLDRERGRASSSLPFRADNGMGEAHEHIRELRLARHLSAESATLRDHDLLRPLHTLEGRAEAPRPPSLDDARAVALGDVATRERYEPYGSYLFPEVSGDQARTMLEQERSRAREAIGASGVRALAPGRWFTLEDHPDAAFHREYVVTRVRHRGRTPEWSAALARSAGAANARAGELAAGRVYENEFECVPASVPFRPRRPKHLVLTTVETATVVGPTEHEIHTDRLGRVKVQFHWDRHGARDERSSCWIRVLQAWAGAGWGHQFLPRVGMEVAVAFLAGDPDKPVVLGSLYNGVAPPPFPLPTSATRSGIRTRSTPRSDGYNELSFEDAVGDEEVFLRAERDLREHVRRNHATRVDGDRGLEVRGARRESVHGDASSSVGGDLHVSVQGLARTELQGSASTHVQGDRESIIQGRERVRIVRSADVEVNEDATLRSTGCTTVVVGAHDAPRSFVLHTEGVVSIHGSHDVRIESTADVVLRAGRSSIRLSDDGIHLSGPVVRIDSEKACLVAGKDIQVRSDEAIGLEAPKVILESSQGGSVGVSSEVKIDGAQVLLNSPAESLEAPAPVDPTTPTVLRLSNSEGEPMRGQRFRIVREDGSETGGVTDAEGCASLILEGGAHVMFPDVGVSDELGEPTGQRRAFVIRRGDHLERLAELHGFDPAEVWQSEDNADLRRARTSPQILNPGDVVIVPGRAPTRQPLRIGASNSFTARVRMLETRVRFFDAQGPWASRSCVIEGLGAPREATTDGDGVLTIAAPASVDAVTVSFPDVHASYHLALGDLDPITEPRGVQMRLSLLGLYMGAVGATWTEAARGALRAFQTAHGLTPTGAPDEATQRALVDAFGS